jgi:hypothetical protein
MLKPNSHTPTSHEDTRVYQIMLYDEMDYSFCMSWQGERIIKEERMNMQKFPTVCLAPHIHMYVHTCAHTYIMQTYMYIYVRMYSMHKQRARGREAHPVNAKKAKVYL